MGLFYENAGEDAAWQYQQDNPAPQADPVITQDMIDAAAVDGAADPYDATLSETLNRGTPNSPALVSDNMQQSGTADFAGVLKKLGSVGSFAKDLGTAVGTIQRELTGAPKAFQTAKDNAANGNKVGQWLQYASTTDKLTVGIGLAGLLFLMFGNN